ncbi:NUDIX hydrolase [Embleya sp. NPDC056575]|uniref:NUDIX hydrolase n=1 Tax=unclassified Embleya TaxID=2699296 RepID=UPI00368CAA6B
MRWTIHGRRFVYESDWVNVRLDDVDIPGVGRVEHHVLTFPRASNTAVVTDDQKRILLMWRHRFITDEWGWEVPAGWSDPGESPEQAIRREIEEETGWRPGDITPMTSYNAISGISTMRFTAFHATGSSCIGQPTDIGEASRVEWVPQDDVVKLIANGSVPDGPSLTALTYYLGIHRFTSEAR